MPRRTIKSSQVPAGSARRQLGAAAAGRSGLTDVSQRVEEIVSAELGRQTS